MESTQKGTGSIQLLWVYIISQFKTPCGHVSFWFYFVFAIIVLGGLGIWVELLKALPKSAITDGLVTSIYTYFPAVAAAAAFQIDLDQGKKNYVRSFALASLFIIFIPAIFQATGLIANRGLSLIIGAVFTLAALALWWVANGKNLSLHDDFDPIDSLGADPGSAASGGTSSIKV
jgi:hypothetical protein